MATSKGAFSRLVRRENKLEICRQYALVRERELREKNAKRIAEHELAARRELAEKYFGETDREKIVQSVLESRSAQFKKDLHLEYCMAREDARREAEKAPEKQEASAAALAALLERHERQLDEYKIKLKGEIEAQLPPEGESPELAAAKERTEKELAAFAESANAETESKVAAINAAAAKKAEALAASCKELERGISAQTAQAELPEGVALRVADLCMYFGGIRAVDGLSFDVKKGEIFGLIGPNGAGKTTVFNCITQFYKPTSGELLFENKAGKTVRLTEERVHDVILQGIVRTFQNVEVIREATVLENLLIAGHRLFTAGLAAQFLHLPSLRREERVVEAKALAVLKFMGLSEYRDWYAYGLPYGVLKRIEIARTLMCSPQLIILDEPAAGLNDTETAELAQLIRRIRDEYNCTILLVEHDMGLVMDICETVCAISFGKLLAIGSPAEIQVNRDVQKAYLGESLDAEDAKEVPDGTA
ncbi:MAG: ABC transporter ATP-binding protein [Oscillospiraceae bacterium]